jgi:membrane dipeptidase
MYVAALVLVVAFVGGAGESNEGAQALNANELAQRFIILDTHIDVPYRLRKRDADISQRTETGDFDYPRAKAGGLDAAFMSIYTPAELEESGGSKALADSLIDTVEGFAVRWPDKFGLASSVEEVVVLKGKGQFALLLGMENGSPVEGDLANLEHFYKRGVRYITLAHSKDNHICDSSYDDRRTWGGLSPFGKTVVEEMNRLGIMIDVSHLSDDAFYQVIELSAAPVIASHSSCRHFTPGFERNMSDDMIRLLAKNGGVIHINFGSTFINDEVRTKFEIGKKKSARYAKDNNLDPKDPAVKRYRDHYFEENPFGFADATEVADHIDHVVELVGVDHVGFGSDFDGLGDSLPTGLKDVSYYPNLLTELLKRGYEERDIEKICSGNLLRVWKEAGRTADAMRASN